MIIHNVYLQTLYFDQLNYYIKIYGGCSSLTRKWKKMIRSLIRNNSKKPFEDICQCLKTLLSTYCFFRYNGLFILNPVYKETVYDYKDLISLYKYSQAGCLEYLYNLFTLYSSSLSFKEKKRFRYSLSLLAGHIVIQERKNHGASYV